MVATWNDAPTVEDICKTTVARITGHDASQLSGEMYIDSDLGIDSIKTVELLNALLAVVPDEARERIDREAMVQKLTELRTLDDLTQLLRDAYEIETPRSSRHIVPASEPTTMSRRASSTARTLVVEAIARVTQHDPGEITDDLSLEADLGIDSIKRVELLTALSAGLSEDVRSDVAGGALQELMQVDLVGDLVAALAGLIGDVPADGGEEIAPEVARQVELELAEAQYTFLVSFLAGVCSCGLLSRVRIEGKFDAAVATAAWEDLLDRHPILRAHFTVPQGETAFDGYKLVWTSSHRAPAMAVDDLRNQTQAQQTEFLDAKVAEGLDRRWPLESWPLHGFQAYRLGESTYEVHFSNHHLISDGIGNQLVLREFLEAYEARAKRQPAVAQRRTTPEEYNEAIRSLNTWVDTGETESLDGYLRKQGRSKFLFNPHGRTVPSGAVATKVALLRLSPEDTSRLNDVVRTSRTSLNSLLVAAYLRTLAEHQPGLSEMILALPTGGRVFPGGDASDLLGCFAQNLALSFAPPSPQESWEALVSRVHATIAEGISSGLDRAQVRRAAVAARSQRGLVDGQMSRLGVSLVRATVKSNVFFPFIGQTRIRRAYGPLRVLDYQAATGTNPGTVDNIVEIFDGALQISSNYDSAFFTRGDIDGLQRTFARHLTALGGRAHAHVEAKGAVVVPLSPSASLERVRGAVQRVRGVQLAAASVTADLEADLGLDSLDRIRVVNAIASRADAKTRQALLACRTLAELASTLEDGEGRLPTARVETRSSSEPETPLGAFVQQAQLTPNAIAVLSSDGPTTYRELDELSNRVAHALARRGITRGALVGVMTSPGPSMLASMLGIMKAGAAYVPLDGEHPSARLSNIIQQSRFSVIVAESRFAAKHLSHADGSPTVKAVLLIDALDAPIERPGVEWVDRHAWESASKAKIDVAVTGGDLMTVLFTSGSTGRPKGAMLNHAGYMNRLTWMQSAFPLSPGDRVAQKTSCGFDVSVWELFWPLMVGATVCTAAPGVTRDPWALAEWIRDQRIQVMHFVPSHFVQFVDSLVPDATFPDLRWLIFSGEALPAPVIRRWMERFGTKIRLANLYGPTEASIDVTSYEITRMPDADERIPIGRAIDNVSLVVLDDQMRPCPAGEMGQLWIGGIAIARGYLRNEEATASAFYRNPFPHIPGTLLYKTGDLVIQSSDGVIHFHGRADSQVKIRGFRIELGEVEAVLGAHPLVTEAAVLAVDGPDDQKHLRGFVAAVGVDSTELRRFVRARLPEYMVPPQIEVRSALPQNANGKLDRKALALGDVDSSPRSPAPASSSLAPAQQPSRGSAPRSQFALAPGQRWLVSYFEAPHAWFGYTRFRYTQPLDIALFERAVASVVEANASLRASFRQQSGAWVQTIAQNVITPVRVVDATQMSDAARDQEMRRLIEQGCAEIRTDVAPLFRVFVLVLPDGSSDIAVVGHHLISDLLSNQILIEQTWRRYARLLGGHESAPGDTRPSATYVDYLSALDDALTPSVLASQIDYWTAQIASRAAFAIPLDDRSGTNDEGSSENESVEFDEGQTRALLGAAKTVYGSTFYHMALAPIYRAMGEWAGQERVVLSHRSHGRDLGGGRTFFDVVGNFAVNFPVAVDSADDLTEMVRRISAQFDSLPMKGVTYDLIGAHLPKGTYPDDRKTPVRVNYLGNRTVASSKLFETKPSDRDQRYCAPHQKRTAALEIFLEVVNSRLRVSCNYSRNLHQRETIRAVVGRIAELFGDLTSDHGRRTRPTRAWVPSSAEPRQGKSSTGRGLSRSEGRRPLEGRVALVTGGARGIGRTTALLLASSGARVAVASRNADQVRSCVEELEAAGGEAFGASVDVSRQPDVDDFIKRTVDRFGRLDILVNNAGITGVAALAESDPEEWRRIVEVNLFGPYYCARAAIPHLLAAGGGKIINVGSDSSVIGYPMLSAYAASKHGLIGLTKALSEELKLLNVQVNAVCPAFVDTEMTPKAFRAQAIPRERVADVILFLATNQSDGVTGEIVRVFGTQDMSWFGSRKMPILKAAVKVST